MSYLPAGHSYPPIRKVDPDATLPEKIPVETSHFTYCSTCQKQIWTQVRRIRGGLERNTLTDAMFKAVSILIVQFDTEFEHTCPTCGQHFKICRKIGHRNKSGTTGKHGAVVVQRRPSVGIPGGPPSQYGAHQRELQGSVAATELERRERAAELDSTAVYEKMSQASTLAVDEGQERR